MSRPSRPAPALPSFGAWNDLAVSTGEMLLASAQVIAHRTGRMALAGPLPSARDRREFALMGSEKVEAAMQSALAMGGSSTTVGLQAGLRVWAGLQAVAQASLAVAASRTPQQAAERQAALAGAIGSAAGAMTELGSAGVRIASGGLRPIHARATANARRLARG